MHPTKQPVMSGRQRAWSSANELQVLDYEDMCDTKGVMELTALLNT